MSMEKPVVATNAAVEGIELSRNVDLLVADSVEEFISKSIELLESGNSKYGKCAREVILKNYLWDKNLQKVKEILCDFWRV